MKDMGDVVYIIVIKIYKDKFKRVIGLSHNTYLDKILNNFRVQYSKKVLVPMQHDKRLSKTQYPYTSRELGRMSRVTYAFAIGSIMYAMICTRYNVSCALSMKIHYHINPSESHRSQWRTFWNILRGLKIRSWSLVIRNS